MAAKSSTVMFNVSLVLELIRRHRVQLFNMVLHLWDIFATGPGVLLREVFLFQSVLYKGFTVFAALGLSVF